MPLPDLNTPLGAADPAAIAAMVSRLETRDLIAVLRVADTANRQRVLEAMDEAAAKDALALLGRTTAIDLRRLHAIARDLAADTGRGASS
ncbi:MAG: hypothetical protein ACOCVS_03655 [Planctomycetota bacterium]